MKRNQYLIYLTIILNLVFSLNPIRADIFGIRADFWSPTSGQKFYQSDLQHRFFLDDILRGTDTVIAGDKYDLPFLNEDQYAIPVKIFYQPGFLTQLRIEGEYYSISATPVYPAFSTMPVPSRIHLNYLNDFTRSTMSGGLAYGFVGFFRNNPISAMYLRAGMTRDVLDFRSRSFVLGTGGATVSPMDNHWDQKGSGAYAGAEINMPVADAWSVFARYDRADSVRGTMNFKEFQVSPASGGGIQIDIQMTSSGYQMRKETRTIGINYHLAGDLVLSFGYRRMTGLVRYPHYLPYSLIVATGSAALFSPVMEVLSDTFIWSETKKETIGNSFVGIEKAFKF